MSQAGQKYVLVVDDEADVRNYLKTALSDAGFRVATANDGLEALESVRSEPPDLISLDLVMPKHSGAKFYHEIQKDKRISSLLIKEIKKKKTENAKLRNKIEELEKNLREQKNKNSELTLKLKEVKKNLKEVEKLREEMIFVKSYIIK